MKRWTPADRRLAMWSARGVIVLSVAYVVTGYCWLVFGNSALPPSLEPTDPYLAILEALLVLSAPVIIVLMAGVHAYAPADRKTATLVALALATVAATLTTVVHFIQLAVVRRLPAGDAVRHVLELYPWPSLLLGLDLLAWDLFFGLAVLFAATAFPGGGLEAVIRLGLRLCGLLCLVGVVAQAVGKMWLQWPAILGYAFVFPAVCVPLGWLFSRTAAEEPRG